MWRQFTDGCAAPSFTRARSHIPHRYQHIQAQACSPLRRLCHDCCDGSGPKRNMRRLTESRCPLPEAMPVSCRCRTPIAEGVPVWTVRPAASCDPRPAPVLSAVVEDQEARSALSLWFGRRHGLMHGAMPSVASLHNDIC